MSEDKVGSVTIIPPWMDQRIIGSRNSRNAIGLHGNQFKMITGHIRPEEQRMCARYVKHLLWNNSYV